jgi:heat shock protein HspQ
MPDVGMLIKGPLAMYIANMAEENNVPYRLFENSDALTEDEMDDQTFFTMMRENNPAMFAYVSNQINESVRKGNAPRPPVEDNFMNMMTDEKE